MEKQSRPFIIIVVLVSMLFYLSCSESMAPRFNDPGGSRNDQGAYGGPKGDRYIKYER